MKPVHDIVSSGADSVFAFIRRSVERDGARCRWKTVDYENRLHYGINIFNGVGGIPLFLADYARLRGNAEALDLAWGALEWCADPAHQGPVRGLHLGQAGPAFAVLHMDGAPLSLAIAALCERVTASILHEDPGPLTDVLGGASSNGFYLLRAWKKRGDPALLAGAVRCGEWVRQHLTRDELGCHCLVRPEGNAFFFALLYEATHESVWKQTALEIFDTLIAQAQPIYGGWNWTILLGNKKLTRCQWSHGAPGIGLAFLRAAEILNEPRLLHAAVMAGEATYHYGDFRNNPTQCVGLAGSGDFLLELWRVTGEKRWLDRARDFGEKVCTYRATPPEGNAWPTDEPDLYSADFMYGAAGTGHFLMRLETQGTLSIPLIAQ